MVDIGMRPNDEGSDRIVEFMRSGAKGFASVEEAADAVSGYLPHRERPKDISGLKKSTTQRRRSLLLALGSSFLTDRTGMGEVREERFRQLENSAKRITVPTLLVQGALSDILTNKEKRNFSTPCLMLSLLKFSKPLIWLLATRTIFSQKLL